jgi:1-acyl-sn-glycerol-3-phosphate acyltransferase
VVIWRAVRTAYEYVALYLGLGLLGLGCLAWCLAAAGLYPVLPRREATRLGRAAIMGGFRFYLTVLEHIGACRFDLTELDRLRAAGPMIVAPNHPCLLDAVMVLSRLPNLACIMKASLIDNIFLGAGARLARYIRNDSLLGMAVLAVEELRAGGQLLVFPEGTRTTELPVSTFRGVFTVLASRARVPVQTVFIETDSPYLCKGWPLFRKPSLPIHYRVRLGRRFDPPADFQTFTRELEQYYAGELADSPMNAVLAGALRELKE